MISAANEGQVSSQCSTPLVSITRFERTTQPGTLPNQMTQMGYPSTAFGQIGLLYPTINQAGYLNPVSYFGTSTPGGDWTARENFYCSPNMGNCGANFPLTMYPTIDGTIRKSKKLWPLNGNGLFRDGKWSILPLESVSNCYYECWTDELVSKRYDCLLYLEVNLIN